MEMDPERTRDFLRENSECILLDVREDEELSYCSIEGNLHVPLGSLPERLTAIDAKLPVVVYCHHGIRSLAAVRLLRAKGFARACSLRGGIDRWTSEIDPSLPRY